MIQTLANKLCEVANQLDRWVIESINGGWSTHQVEPMRTLSRDILALLRGLGL